MLPTVAPLSHGLLILLLGFVQGEPNKQAQDLIDKMRSDKIEERDEATRKLRLLGKSAEVVLKEAVQDGDPEVASRARALLRRLEIQSRLTPELRKTFPDVEDRLARGNDHDWTEVFLIATSKTNGFDRKYSNLKKDDLEAIGSLAILGASSADEKKALCKAIQFNFLQRTAPELLSLLHDGDPEVRREAVRAVGTMRVPGVIPHLRQLVSDRSGLVRATVGPMLGFLGAKEAIPDLMTLLDDKDSYVRFGAVNALGNLGAAEAIPRITELLRDADVCEMSLKMLAKLDARESIPKIVPLLANDQLDKRVAAAQSLADLGAQESVLEVAKLLRDKDPCGRCAGLMALKALRARQLASHILPLLEDPLPIVRAMAAEALGGLGDSQVLPNLGRLLKDKNAFVRIQAMLAVSELGSNEDIVKLKEMLKDDGNVSDAVAEAMADSDKVGVLLEETLSRMGLNREKRTVRSFAGVGLCALGSESGVEPFLEVMDEWGIGCNPIVLNAIREPEAWRILRGKTLQKPFRGKTNELLGAIAEHCAVRLEFDSKDLERSVADGAGWITRGWAEGTPLLEALESMLAERGCTLLVESDRLRIVNFHDAENAWNSWLRTRKK